MNRAYKVIVLCFVFAGIMTIAMIYFEVSFYIVYKLTLQDILSTNCSTRTCHPAVGLAHDDPVLIKIIKQEIHRPTGMPYYLDHPEGTDFSEGQTGCVKNILKDKKDGFFLEVGAFDGEAASNSLYWERERGWTGLLIEPNPEVYNSLLMRKQRRCLSLQSALCLNNTADMITLDFPAFAKNWLKPLHPPGFVFPDTINVPCYPLTSILTAIGNHTIDYFVMDLDGGEMDVLQSIDLKAIDIHVFQIEHVKIKGGIDVLRKLMEENGYSYNTSCVFDAFFVKKDITL